MKVNILRKPGRLFAAATLLAVVSIAALVIVLATTAQADSAYFYPGKQLVCGHGQHYSRGDGSAPELLALQLPDACNRRS